MLTDTPPRKKNRESFSISDRTKALELPRDGQLVRLAGSIESAMRKWSDRRCSRGLRGAPGHCVRSLQRPALPNPCSYGQTLSRSGILDDGAFRRSSPFDDADPGVDENGRSEGDHFIRNFSEYAFS